MCMGRMDQNGNFSNSATLRNFFPDDHDHGVVFLTEHQQIALDLLQQCCYKFLLYNVDSNFAVDCFNRKFHISCERLRK